ncbi:MAG: hypothetical protein AAGA87_02660 [Pseudomonadota bacterium]
MSWPPETVVLGLNLAVITGACSLTILRGIPPLDLFLDPFVIAAGLLTFPIGTGLYYISSVWFRNRAALAAQFAQVKPIITISFGLLVFSEVLNVWSILAAGVITLGIATLVYGVIQKHTSLGVMFFGFMLACAWGLGEVAVRFAGQFGRFDIAHASLVAAILPTIAIWGVVRIIRRNEPVSWPDKTTLIAFSAHGIMSFGGAYFFFFASISLHGLSHTVLITTFWPVLAIVISYVLDRTTLQNLSTETMVAMTLFTIGSFLHVTGAVLGR